MDFEDDPDITPWHLSQRLRMFQRLAEEERKNEEKAKKLVGVVQDPDRMIYTYKNILLRLFLAVVFLSGCIGLLAVSIFIDEKDLESTTSASITNVPKRESCQSSIVTFTNFKKLKNVSHSLKCTVLQDYQNQWVKLTFGDKLNCSQVYVEIYFMRDDSYVLYGNDKDCQQLSCIYSPEQTYEKYADYKAYLKKSLTNWLVSEQIISFDCDKTTDIGKYMTTLNKTAMQCSTDKRDIAIDKLTSVSSSILSTILRYFWKDT